MAQDFSLGRAGLASASGGDGLTLHLKSEDGWSQEGDRASIRGVLKGTDFSSLADLKAARDQLQGYGPDNPDESVVPVTSVQDASRDGFYRVLSVEVESEASGRLSSSSAAGKLAIPWRAELLRVPGWQAPLFEVAYSGADRDTGHAITPDEWVAVLGAALTGGVASPISVSGETGGLAWHGLSSYSGAITYAGSTSGFYGAGASLQVSYDSGSTWRTVVGRQTINQPAYWRISNGVARATANPATSGGFKVGYYDQPSGANAWEEQDFVLGTTSSITVFSDTWANAYLTVLRNSPECVTIRLTWKSTTGYLDLTVRRGAGGIECLWFQNLGVQLGVRRDASDAATAVTGGVRDTTATDGNRWGLFSPQAVGTIVVGTSGIYQSVAASSFPFFVTNTFDGYGAGAAVPAAGAYFAAMNHHQRIVAR